MVWELCHLHIEIQLQKYRVTLVTKCHEVAVLLVVAVVIVVGGSSVVRFKARWPALYYIYAISGVVWNPGDPTCVCAQCPRLSDTAPHVTCLPLAATAMTTRPRYCRVQFTSIISANRRLLNHFQPCGHTHTANMRCKAIKVPVVARQPRRCTFSLDITYLGCGMILFCPWRNLGKPWKGGIVNKGAWTQCFLSGSFIENWSIVSTSSPFRSLQAWLINHHHTSKAKRVEPRWTPLTGIFITVFVLFCSGVFQLWHSILIF